MTLNFFVQHVIPSLFCLVLTVWQLLHMGPGRGKCPCCPFQSRAYVAVLTDIDRHLPQSLTRLPQFPNPTGGETLTAADPVAEAVASWERRRRIPRACGGAGGSGAWIRPWIHRIGVAWQGTRAWASNRIGFRTSEFTASPLVSWCPVFVVLIGI